PSYITDKLCREIYDKAGVPVPRANYVRVRLNQRDMGLYLLTEGWGKDFLKRYYKNVKGNLYDGGFVKDITSQKDVNSGENPDDTSDLKALALAAREPNLARRLAGLESHLDMEKFITMLALDALDWNWDGYGLNHNNYRVFHDLEKDRMVFFPHGMDQMFWKAEGPVAPAMKGLVGRAAMQLPQVRQRYLERMKELMGGVFKLETITNRVAELAARVYPALRGLPDQEEASNYPNQLSILFQRIESRYANIEKQLLGVQQLLKVKKGDAANIKVWDQRSEPNLHTPGARAQGKELELVAGTARGARIWGSTVWLEQGKYRLEGKIKVSGLVPATDPDRAAAPTTEFMNGIMRRFMSASGEPGGAGFRVWTERKQTEGNEWDWFPYRESQNFRRRGLLPASAETGKRISGDMDWTVVTYEFELRQPIADLHILFDLSATKGKAVLDADSVKLIRLSQ
ncbi:MAG TPA: CotH kinase family protein, partial [Verrucomicrobiae bacterium]